jgi:hypothetical protein
LRPTCNLQNFATYALPKVASRAQNTCFAPYLQPSVYEFISVELFHGTEMLRVSRRCFLPPQTSYYFFPCSSPLLIGSAYCIAAAIACSLFPPLSSLPASVGRAAEAARQWCGDSGQCGGGVSSARAMEAAQWRRWRRWRREAAGRQQQQRQSGSGGGSTATAVAERQQGDRVAAMATAEWRRQHGNGSGSVGSAVAARQQSGNGGQCCDGVGSARRQWQG